MEKPKIRRNVEFRQPQSGKASAKVPVEMVYDATKPYEVVLSFRPDAKSGEETDWVIGRTLLRDGLITRRGRRVGIGDVRIGTSKESEQTTLIELQSPDGEAIFEAGRQDLTSFVRATAKVVPFGRESDYIDMDKEISNLLDY